MKKRTIFFLIIISLINIPLIYSATDEGYGEANDNLGQFTDSFENDDNVSVAYQVINNVTLECMELNYTYAAKEYENYSTYIEIDEDGDITVTDYNINFITMRRDAVSRVVKDYGIDYFTDFQHELDMNMTDVEAGGASSRATVSCWGISDAFGAWSTINSQKSITLWVRQSTTTDDIFNFNLLWREGGAILGTTIGINYAINTDLYLTINRTDDDIWVKVYTDSERTVLSETLSLNNMANSKFRYFYGLLNIGAATDPADYVSGNFKYLWFGNYTGGYDLNGYLITEDYLNYTTGNSLTLLTNASIPEGTSMTVQFSNDNSTWVDNEGNVGSTSILDGFNAIDLRNLNYTDDYKMVNFTGTPELTPRLYQLREITTNGTVRGIGGIVYIYHSQSVIMLIFLCLIGLIILLGVKKR